MSAFVVSDDCMKRVVLAICARNRYGQIVPRFDGIHTQDENAATEIGRRLFTLNIEAVFQRYPDTQDKPENMPGPVDSSGKSTALKDAARFVGPRRLTTYATETLVDSVKAMRCLGYQCAEGDIPETKLYRELREAIGAVACEIVDRMPAYEKASWG